MRLIKLIIIAISALALVTPPARAATKELILAHLGSPGSMHDLAALEYQRRVNPKLPPEFKVVVAGDSRYGYDDEVLKKIKAGEVTFGLPGSIMSTISAKFGVFELPFLVRNREQVSKISDAILEPVLQPEAKKKGYRLLAMWENGFRQFTNNTRPIRRPQDLTGLSIRAPKSPWWEHVLNTLGAEPIQLKYTDVHIKLKSGELNGQEAPLAQIRAAKLDEVQKYLSLSDHIYTPIYLIVSEEHFAQLPPGVQDILTRTAQEMRSWIYSTAIKLESQLVDQLGETMQVNYIDLKAFRQASRPLYGEFARTVPGGLRLIETVSELAEVPASEVGLGTQTSEPVKTPPSSSAAAVVPPAAPKASSGLVSD